MQVRMPTSERLSKQASTRRALRLSSCLTLVFFSCVVIAQAQMKPMSDVTVSPGETTKGQRATSTPDTSTQGTATQSNSTRDASTPRAATQAAPAQDTTTRTTTSRETNAPVTRTRARRVSPETAPTTAQPEREVKERAAGRASSPAEVKTESVKAEAGIDMEEPPSMPSEAKGAAKGEAKSADRLSTLRAQVEDAKDERERARLRRMLVDYLVSLDQKHEAVKELRSMMREERFDPVGFYNIGNALVRLDDANTAIDAYRKAISQRHGNYARALNNLGVVLLRQGRWDEAQEALASALRQENYHYAEASYNLGRLYAARGEADLAIAEWRRTLSIQPDHSDAALALARAYALDASPQRGPGVAPK